VLNFCVVILIELSVLFFMNMFSYSFTSCIFCHANKTLRKETERGIVKWMKKRIHAKYVMPGQRETETDPSLEMTEEGGWE
jgi:hypothetical protein